MTVKLSPVACQAWVDTLKKFLEGRWNTKIVIPTVSYFPNTDSDNGRDKETNFLIVEFDTIDEVIKTIPINSKGRETALSRNITYVTEDKRPTMATLDIIDCKPDVQLFELEPFKVKYNIFKTKNSYHLYPKTQVDNGNGGEIIKDPQWRMEYIRITESAAKGAITKYEG